MRIALRSLCVALFAVCGVGMAMPQSRDSGEYKSQTWHPNVSQRGEDTKAFGIQTPEHCGYILVLKVRNVDPKVIKPMQVGDPMPILEGLGSCSQPSERKRRFSTKTPRALMFR